MGVVALLLVACSGGDDVAAPTTSDAAGPSTTTTVTPSTTTSTPSEPTTTSTTTTEPPATTSPTTTVVPPSTTLPEGVPPRVTFPDDPDRQAVVDAVYAYFDALNDAQAAPLDDRARERVLATTVDPIRGRVVDYLDRLVIDGEAFVSSSEPTTIDIFEDVMSLVADAALVDACVVDRSVHVEVGAGQGGDDRVLNDQVVAAVLSYSLNRTPDGWRVSDLDVANRFEDQAECG